MGKLTISISEELYRVIKREAVRSNRSIAQVVDERLRTKGGSHGHSVSRPVYDQIDADSLGPPIHRFNGLEI